MEQNKKKTSLTLSLNEDDNYLNNQIEVSKELQNSLLQSIVSSIKPKISNTSKDIVPFYKLYRYATYLEILTLVFATIFGILSGFGLPLAVILYGEFTTLLIDRVVQNGTSTSAFLIQFFGGGKVLTNPPFEENQQALLDDSAAFSIACLTISAVQCLFGILSIDSFNFVALRQINRIRKMFFESVLRQDMTWYDTNTGTNFASSITEDLDKLKNGIGEKVSICIYLVSTFIIFTVISFIYGWKLTLVILTCAPVIYISTSIVAKVQSSLTEKELKTYSSAGIVAEEVLGSIRTVVAFGGENKEIQRFSDKLKSAISIGKRKGIYSGIGNGIMWFITFGISSLGFWYGITLVLEDSHKDIPDYTPGVIVIVYFGILVGVQNLAFTGPHLETIAAARGSAAAVFKILDRKPLIDPLSIDGIKPSYVKGELEFQNVHFNYPSRPTVKVLCGLNLKIKSGERVAFVGSSGCGKSTLIQLVQRLYDPLNGTVMLDGNDISKLNVKYLREKIGVVGQEPVLFSTTIAQNIILGNSNATQEDIEKAAIEANCHDFIKKLPNGYDTMVGERGSQLSGGQKQRIAIARALIGNPKILLLDEATSALDYHSEKKVQDALDKASFHCTTLIVSHRLSTIRNVDRIVFIKDGVVAEMGTHEELMDKKQLYFNLVAADTHPEMSEEQIQPTIKTQDSIHKKTIENNSDEDSSIDFSEEKLKNNEDEIDTSSSLWRLLKLNLSEWPYISIGIIASLCVGTSVPAFAIIFGETYGILSLPDKQVVMQKAKEYALLFVIVGVLIGIAAFLQNYMFNIAGIKLTTRMRILSFGAMLKQEIGWYDENKNSVGALCARLSSDASGVQSATGTWLSAIFQTLATLLIGIIISLFFAWKLTLASLVTIPLIAGSFWLEGRFASGSGMKEKQSLESATKIAVEAISNVRTVASLCQEKHFIQNYLTEIEKVNVALKFRNRFRGIVFSFGQVCPFIGYAISLWYGGYLVAYQEIEYKNVIKVSEAMIYGAFMMGQALAFAPNINTAKISAARIFHLIDRIPKITSPPDLSTDNNWKADGHIKYSKIDFSYPTRPETQILKQLNLTVQVGRTVALVGGSGCGKSTCIQLLQRFYDPDLGVITLDNKDISRDMSIPLLRSQLGIVSQEPVLFDRTIAENIAYGDNNRIVTQDEIIDVAKKSNIHSYISSLPLGYETKIGTRGTQLSGGQKQRIAIARALIRNPRVLLLDEATSALDNESEKVVQIALDVACEGRTCIIIAHRLSTIRNADIIYVMEDGKVVETGSHNKLISAGGMYSKLYNVNK